MTGWVLLELADQSEADRFHSALQAGQVTFEGPGFHDVAVFTPAPGVVIDIRSQDTGRRVLIDLDGIPDRPARHTTLCGSCWSPEPCRHIPVRREPNEPDPGPDYAAYERLVYGATWPGRYGG